ncbi:MAG: EamA family transporter, partial [Albidovulum sp.]|uniref:EamA family transporter n=1 Tax=Albidovulum sp. TaxID=1872424 RepID=UPI003C81040D
FIAYYPILLALISAFGNTINSLLSAWSTKSGTFNSTVCVVYSIIPSFIICLVFAILSDHEISLGIFALLCLKNVLYGSGFYLRLRGIEHLGAFNGALMAASQPVLISVMSLIILSEELGTVQWVSIGAVFAAIFLPVRGSAVTLKDLMYYVAIPTFLFSGTVIFDRYLLTTHLEPTNFFVWDKISVLPAVLLSLLFAGKLRNTDFSPVKIFSSKKASFIIILMGLSWGIASYTYAVALSGEKAAIITLVRNLAFPLTAIIGGFIFREAIRTSQYLSLAIVVGAIFCGTLL